MPPPSASSPSHRSPLTPELLRARFARLLTEISVHVPMEPGDPPAIAYSLLVCDGCGLRAALVDGLPPVGWTSAGDEQAGFDDRCEGCSA